MKLLARNVARTHALLVTVHAACAAFGPHVLLLLQGRLLRLLHAPHLGTSSFNKQPSPVSSCVNTLLAASVPLYLRTALGTQDF